MTNDSVDDIIVGAGSSGCVLANRLSADPKRRVLLLEAGGVDNSLLISMPKGMGKLIPDPKRAWHFPVQQPRETDVPSTEVWVRGKMLGGSSSINGMIYSRGQPEDYSTWEARGAAGWGWKRYCRRHRGAFPWSVLPRSAYLRRLRRNARRLVFK